MSMAVICPLLIFASLMVCKPGPQPMSRICGWSIGGIMLYACSVYSSRPDPSRGRSLWMSKKISQSMLGAMVLVVILLLVFLFCFR